MNCVALAENQKKADVREHPGVFPHVGLLIIEPPGPGLNQTSRVALYLVIRRLRFAADFAKHAFDSSHLSTQGDLIKRDGESKSVIVLILQLVSFRHENTGRDRIRHLRRDQSL